MPELPEVESIRLHLAKRLTGHKIINISYDWPKKFDWGKYSIDDLKKAKITGVRRLGKVIIIDLVIGQLGNWGIREKPKYLKTQEPSNLINLSILFHLKMTGQIILQIGKDRIAGGHPIPPLNLPVPNSTTRATFIFDDGHIMYFNDLRKFGWVKIMSTPEVEKEQLLEKLGPDPQTSDFSLSYFVKAINKKKGVVKVAIMDQTIAAGVGNIYASEALFFAKVKPDRKIISLTKKEIRAIYDGIVKALKTGLKYGGASVASYIKPDGNEGVYLKYAYVYNRKGKPCKICKTAIEKIKLGQRGTFFCPSCQK